MLHRIDGDDVITISQPAHAWISGQLAAAWGNELVGNLQPRRDVLLAAEQHDIGWLSWEAAPTLNPETGLPHTFMTIPTAEHLALWSPAGELALAYGRYAALLISRHGTSLYRRYHNWEADSPGEAAATKTFLENTEVFETRLIHDLQSDPTTAELASDQQIDRNRRLIGLWDGISLNLCHGLTEEQSYGPIPAAEGDIELTLRPLDDAGSRVEVDPWPFKSDQVTVACHARRLTDRFDSQDAMRQALATAPWQQIKIQLQPAKGS